MSDLITVFRMTELSVETRINIIIKLGQLINMQYAANVTEAIVDELISALRKEPQSE